MSEVRYLVAGDSAVCVEFGNEISPEINKKIRAFKIAVEKSDIPGIVETVPTYRSCIKFASGGFLTTVQDMGRTGYQESGMSVSGVMDQRSAAIANILVGNDENEAVLEVTLMGPMMEFTEDNIIAVTGGNLVPKVNGKDLPMYQAVLVHKGDSMNFAGMTSGSRAYIAVAGGLDIPVRWAANPLT